MRKSIDGLAAIVQQQFQLDPFSRNLLEEDGQLNLFNEIEVEGDPTRKEKDPIQVSRNKVKVRQPKTRREVVTHGLPEEEVVLDIPEKEANCVQCGSKLKPIGKKVVREALQYIPASLKIIRYVQISYECPRCKHTDNPYIVSRKAPAPVLNHSLASPSTVADIIANKYRDALPLYRHKQEAAALAVCLSLIQSRKPNGRSWD